MPQFTEVEDKIIAGLTLKQFGLLFGAGIVVFLAYSASKSLLVTIFVFLVAGLPALVTAFAKINGRALYTTFPIIAKFLLRPKLLVFHKQANNITGATQIKEVDIKIAETKLVAIANPKERLKELNRLLQQKAEEERELFKDRR